MESADVNNDCCLRFLKNFFYAATSSLLVAVPRLSPDYAIISLVALAPFLWRAIHVGFIDSLVLGALFGTLFYFMTAQIEFAETTKALFPCFPAIIILLSIYSASVNRIAKHIGFNAVFLAILWLPVEYALGYCSYLSGIFVFADLDSSILARISSLFGVLMISFLVVFINSLIIVVSHHLARSSWSRSTHRTGDPETTFAICILIKTLNISYNIPAIRAPPR